MSVLHVFNATPLQPKLRTCPEDEAIAALRDRVALVAREHHGGPVRAARAFAAQAFLPDFPAHLEVETHRGAGVVVNVNAALMHDAGADPLGRTRLMPDAARLGHVAAAAGAHRHCTAAEATHRDDDAVAKDRRGVNQRSERRSEGRMVKVSTSRRRAPTRARRWSRGRAARCCPLCLLRKRRPSPWAKAQA